MSELGDDMYIETSGDPTKRGVEMFHSRIDNLNRDHILESMGEPNGSVRVLIATTAYGMGINCKNVKTVLSCKEAAGLVGQTRKCASL